MKIEITPKIVEQFNEEGRPAICSIGGKNICFNKPAQLMLGMDVGSLFLLEFEDGNLYYKDTTTGFKLTSKGKNVLMVNVTGIGNYIEKFFKKSLKVYRFEVGEFKDGRRKLALVA